MIDLIEVFPDPDFPMSSTLLLAAAAAASDIVSNKGGFVFYLRGDSASIRRRFSLIIA
jgi:hypothetical protein